MNLAENSVPHFYGPGELECIKVYRRELMTDDAIVFIHGGGWRDPANTADDFVPIMEHLLNNRSRAMNIISINYRLSPRVDTEEELKNQPKFRFPMHLVDVVRALDRVIAKGFNITQLVGHSVGAGFCMQLLNYNEIIYQGIPYLTDFKQELMSNLELHETTQLFGKINLENIFLLDGIYDVEALIEEYPEYIFMVRCAFDSKEHYKATSQLSNPNISAPNKLIGPDTKIHIIHSLQDEYLSTKQSLKLQEYLEGHQIPNQLVFKNWGLHEEIYTRPEVANYMLSYIDN